MSDLDRYLAPTPRDPDPLVNDLVDEQAQRASVIALHGARPDTAALANRLARQEGLPPDVVERNLGTFRARSRARQAQDLARRYPAIGRFASNPRNAAVAQDDLENLAKVAELFLAKQPKPLALFNRGMARLEGGMSRFLGTAARSFELDGIGRRYLNTAEEAEAIAGAPVEGEVTWDDVKHARAPIAKVIPFALDQGIGSIGDMLLTANPAGLGALIASNAGRVGQNRATNDRRKDAEVGDIMKATPAAVASAFMEKIGATAIVGPGLLRGVVREAGTEAAQEALEYGSASIGTKTGFDPGTAVDQAMAGAVGGAGYAAMGGAVGEGARLREAMVERKQRVQAWRAWAAAGGQDNLESVPRKSRSVVREQAQQEGAFLHSLAKGSAGSKTRELDPEAYSAFIHDQVEGTDLEYVYIAACMSPDYF